MTVTAYPDDAERDVRAHLKARLKVLKGRLRKVKWIGRNGAPDELVLLPARLGRPPSGFLMELKRPGKVPEPHQQREIDLLRKHGFRVEVIDSREAVDAALFW